MDKELRILMLEDSPADAELEEHELRKSGLVFTLKVVDTKEAFLKELDNFSHDIILSDYDLPTFNGLEALEIAKNKCPSVPFILVTGRVGEEFAIETLKKGVIDYVLKNNLRRLTPSVVRALEEAKLIAERTRVEEERAKSYKEIQLLLKGTRTILDAGDFPSTARRIFDMAREMTGAQSGYVALLSEDGEENEVLFLESGGLPCSVDPHLPMPIRGLRGDAYETGHTVHENDFMNSQWMAFMPGGHVELKNVLFAPLNIEGKTVGIMGLANKPSDFTDDDFRIAEAFGQQVAIALKNSRNLDALFQSEDKYRLLFQNVMNGFAVHEIVVDKKGKPVDYVFLEVNGAFERLTTLQRDSLIGKRVTEVLPGIEKDPADWIGRYGEVALTGREIRFEQFSQGINKWFSVLAFSPRKNQFAAIFEDITERKRAEAEIKRNELRMAALLELNKMIDSPLQDITRFALEEAIRVTDSKIGYFAFVNEDETNLTMYSWSKTAMEECRIQDKPIIYAVETTGLWGEAVRQRRPIITNDYEAANPLKKGYPEGHLQVTRHMNVPVFDGKRIVLVAGVGNKQENYNESDVNQLTLLMEGMWSIIQRQQAGKKVHEQLEFVQTLLNTIPSPVFYKNVEGKYLGCNEAFEVFTGTKKEALIGKTVYDMGPKEIADKYLEKDNELFQHPGAQTYEWKVKDKNGILRDVIFSKAIFNDAEGRLAGLVGVITDITESKQIEQSLKLDEERLEALLNLTQMEIKSEKEITDFALAEAVRLTKSTGGYLHFFNEDEQTIQLYSWSKDVLKICIAAQDHHYPLDAAGVWADSVRLRKAVIHNDYQSMADKKGYPEGHFHLMRHLGIPIFDGGRIVGVTGVGNKETPYDEADTRQITLLMNSMWGILKHKRSDQERERHMAELQLLSIKDELTGLYNRRGIFSMARHQYSIAKRIHKFLMLVFVDLDGMKKINDLYGHSEGDNALIDTANILKNTFRETDIIARIGGDEFAVFGMVLEDKGMDIVTARINEKLEKHLAEYASHSTKPYKLSLSNGIAFADPQKPFSFDAMLSEADQNMYLQKQKKKGSEG